MGRDNWGQSRLSLHFPNGGQAIDKLAGATWTWGHAGGAQGITYTNGSTYFDHSDWVGTARARSNVSGVRIETCTSLPFGESQSCAGTDESPQHFAGLSWDSESNLQQALFRQYSTTEGRWIHPDPSGLAAVDTTNPQTWNRYAYVANDPTGSVDPLGLFLVICRQIQGELICLDGTGDGTAGMGFPYAITTIASGGGGGLNLGFDFGGLGCGSDFMPCGLPMPGLGQSIWSDVLGLPTGLNCPQMGGIFSPLCGGVSPAMDAVGLHLTPPVDLFASMGLDQLYSLLSGCGKLRGFFGHCFYGCYGMSGESPEVAYSLQHFTFGTINEACPYLPNPGSCPTTVITEVWLNQNTGMFVTKPKLLACAP